LLPLHLDYIGFEETKKGHFSNYCLKNLLGNINFTWNHLPAKGTTGGAFVGVNCDIFEKVVWEIKQFSVCVAVKNKINDFVCRTTMVYGSAYEEKKEFISELHEP
jgi:hypothetical protein